MDITARRWYARFLFHVRLILEVKMRTKKIFFLIMYEAIVIGAFIAGLPLMLRVFSNPVTALILVGAIVAGCGVVIVLAFLSCMRCGGRMRLRMLFLSYCPHCSDNSDRKNSIMR